MSEVYFNQYIGNLQADYASSATSLVVAPVPRGPTLNDTWRLLIGSEWLKVTLTRDNGDGTATLTVVRGAEGSAAAALRKGQQARSILTAEAVQALGTQAANQAAAINQTTSPQARVRSVAERLYLANTFS